MDIVTIQKNIEKKISELEKGRKILKERSSNKATKEADYEKMIAICILKLKNNMIEEFEGINCQNLPATLIEKTARGICFKEKLAQIQAEGEYKAAIVGMQALQSELNGYQSIFKYSQYSEND